MTDEPFQLRSEPARPRGERFTSTTGRQLVLLSGLDCLSGQRDFFTTDGEEDHATDCELAMHRIDEPRATAGG